MKPNPIIACCTVQNCRRDESAEQQVHRKKVFAQNPALFGEEPY